MKKLKASNYTENWRIKPLWGRNSLFVPLKWRRPCGRPGVLNFSGKQSKPSTGLLLSRHASQQLKQKDRDRESIWEGNSADFIRTGVAVFEIGQLQDGGLPSESTTRWLGHLAAFEVSPVHVCVCVTECVILGIVIQTHVNVIFSDRSSLFYCKRGSRHEGGGQNQTGWDLLDSSWKQLTAAKEVFHLPVWSINDYN